MLGSLGNKLAILFLSLSLLSCTKESQEPLDKKIGYHLEITTSKSDDRVVSLYALTPSPKLVDSVKIKNNIAVFKGSIADAERCAISIIGVKKSKMFILANDNIFIRVDQNDMLKSTISGSKINTELISFQKKSEKITSKIELLFPELQRARLENDAEKIMQIATQIEAIENENIWYNFKYVTEHLDSYISGMVLNDLSKRDNIDLNRILDMYHRLSPHVQESADGKELKETLGL